MAIDIKILKAKCKVCGKRFLFELRNEEGEFKVANMEEAVPEHYESLSSTIRQDVYHTAGNLQKDQQDGKRIVGGYAYPRKGYPCKVDSPYNFSCCYCKELEFDYSKRVGKNPYGKWAGVSNIPDVEVDEYGNAKGSSFDLAEDGAFKGYRVIILNFACLTRKDAKMDKVSAELEKKGFEVIELRSNSSMENRLKELLSDKKADKTQVWILSSSESILSFSAFSLIKRFAEKGHGLYLLGDDEPSFAEANRFLVLYNAKMEGDYPGKKLLTVTENIDRPGIIKDHLVTTGIVNFFEGKTVAGINLGPRSAFKPLIRGSNGEILACYYEEQGRRIIADGGYTRLYAGWEQAGNERYFSNVAAYLANIEKFGYDPE